MKNIIIGTAGHIDHGKTTLIKALTGRNTDRWKEEQERGITIDLGFTWFDLKSGERVGIIDVPGHEKFINNMVAGVVGMDMVMLVVAADEGIMPQTREHMDILSLLGIEKSILVLNKCDLVDEDWLELMEEEIKEELQGTFLENAPVVRVSSTTGDGLDALVDTISRLMRDEVKEKEVNTIPRLPIDRCFTISGFGTVVTGTLISGSIRKDDVLEVYPTGKECKIRNIQVHGKNVDSCQAGQRVALNISNLKKSELKRGCVIAPKNNMKNTMMLDVNLCILPDSERILNNRDRLHFYSGTSEVLCRAVLLDREELGPGENGLVQLRLESQVALKKGDRFVVRFYSPMETIGGGVVLEPNPKKKKRFDEKALDELRRKEKGSLADVMELHIREHGDTMITMAELAKIMAHSAEELESYKEELLEQQLILEFPLKKDSYLWHRDSEYVMREKILAHINDFHGKYPYRYGVKKAEIYSTYMKKVKANVFDLYVDRLVSEGALGRKGDYLYAADFAISQDETYVALESAIRGALESARFDFLRFAEIDLAGQNPDIAEDIQQILVDDGVVLRLCDDLLTLSNYAEEAKTRIAQHLAENNLITIGEVRDMFETSRKSARAILDLTDRLKITKKVGAETERVAY